MGMGGTRDEKYERSEGRLIVVAKTISFRRTFFTGFQQSQADLKDGVEAFGQEKVEDAKDQRQRELEWGIGRWNEFFFSSGLKDLHDLPWSRSSNAALKGGPPWLQTVSRTTVMQTYEPRSAARANAGASLASCPPPAARAIRWGAAEIMRPQYFSLAGTQTNW